ncbi:MAG: hypothetical protein HXY26_07035 [Hydrogenophilaceae bacterium]|nr:hypothetical protein [Hydrogenophilaceae bacterium]
MNKLGLLALATQFAPRLFQIRRGTWIGLGMGLVVLFGLFVWAAVALAGWLFGQAQGWLGAAQDTAAGPAQSVLEQVERVAPAAREKLDAHLGEYLPVLKAEPEPARDVSGEDLGPVPRYAGLVRSAWLRDGSTTAAEFTGQASYTAVLDHYARGFPALGYAQSVLSATRDAETHAYTKGAERYNVTVTRSGGQQVSVRIEAKRP